MNYVNDTCPLLSTYSFLTPLTTIPLLAPLILSNCHLVGSYPKDRSSQVYQQRNPEYDFIIVGAGSAGCTVASRLSEITNWKILLIEAGTDPPITSDIPTLAATLFKTKYDWSYVTEPTGDTCLGFKNNQCFWPRGKVLGGCSTINYMLAIRGSPLDYDKWESMGNPGWSYKDVLKYFIKLERLRIPKLNNESIHGYNGNVYLEEYTNKTLHNSAQVENYIANYAIAQGYDVIEDLSASYMSGVTLVPGTLHDDVRWNTAKAYLQPARHRSNLVVMKGTLVTKILINDKNKAYGVEVFKNGKYKRIHCKKEIIISAGSINTPQLMMLSGIGPKDHLNDLGIPVRKDSPVGFNLQDHLLTFGSVVKLNFPSYETSYSTATFLYEYLSKRIDIGTVVNSMIFFNTTGHQANYPNIQLYHMAFAKDDKTLLADYILGPLKSEIAGGFKKLNEESALLFLYPVLLRPKSRGRIILKNKDPFQKPLIFSGYLTMKEDLEEVIEAFRVIEKISKTSVFQKHGTLTRVLIKDCLKFPTESDKYYECYVRHLGATTFHPVGTCKMGPSKDPSAVVSAELKVHGVEGLRVVDGSIMPEITGSNVNIPIIMIGEKASDMIKSDWL